MNVSSVSVISSLFLVFLSSMAGFPQHHDPAVNEVLRQDSIFWLAYNNCDVNKMSSFMEDDLEFYHDRGGVQKGVGVFRETAQKNLCGNTNFRIRREAVAGSVQLFPMKSGDSLYGAVLSGEHFFYITESGKKERLDGLARFTHLWLLKNGNWKMSRILSYDHGPASRLKKASVRLPVGVLERYAGKYTGTHTGEVTVTTADSVLHLHINNEVSVLRPSSESIFFTDGRDLQFEFVKKNDRVQKMIVRENGEVAEELTAVTPANSNRR